MRRSIFHRNNIYRSVIINVNLNFSDLGTLKTMEFRSLCCFCVRHIKPSDKLSVRQQSIYCVKNSRNTLSRKQWLYISSDRHLFRKAVTKLFCIGYHYLARFHDILAFSFGRLEYTPGVGPVPLGSNFFFFKFNQIRCASNLHEWHMQLLPGALGRSQKVKCDII